MLNVQLIPFSPRFENSFRDYLLSFSKVVLEQEREKIMDTKELVKREVALKIVGRDFFTCYDITKSLRSHKDVFHNEVREAIYELEKEGFICGYSRTTCEFADGTQVEVFYDNYNNGWDEAQEYINSIDKTQPKTPVTVGTSLAVDGTCTACKAEILSLEHELANALNFLYDINTAVFNASIIDTMTDLEDFVLTLKK